MISKKTRIAIKRVLWVFIPAVLVFALGVAALDFYFIHRMTHPPRTALYGSPRDFQLILQKPMWFEEKWKNSDSTQTAGCWAEASPRPRSFSVTATVRIAPSCSLSASNCGSQAITFWSTIYAVTARVPCNGRGWAHMRRKICCPR